jgi:hypothetical protein
MLIEDTTPEKNHGFLREFGSLSTRLDVNIEAAMAASEIEPSHRRGDPRGKCLATNEGRQRIGSPNLTQIDQGAL